MRPPPPRFALRRDDSPEKSRVRVALIDSALSPGDADTTRGADWSRARSCVAAQVPYCLRDGRLSERAGADPRGGGLTLNSLPAHYAQLV